MKLPVIFVCENNLFSSHLHINLRQPGNSTERFAKAHLINSCVVDGNDIVEVSKKAKEGIERARNGEGPFFMEAITYRWRGHVGPSEDIDVGVKRGTDLVEWRMRDPISRLATSLIQKKIITQSDYEALQKNTDADIKASWSKAMEDPYPHPDFLLETVYETQKEASK